MSVFLFPGQGSQQKGMGQAQFAQFPQLVQQADEILGYSIEELCLHDPNNQLNQTLYTQPALYTTNALTFFSKHQQPDYAAGHSLGEYNALLSADVFDFATGLSLVKKRAELMQQAAGGGMAAIIGLDAYTIRSVLDDNGFHSVDLANYNAPQQIVISGMKTDIDAVQPLLEQHGAMMVIPLKVSGAFHSRYMETARIEFERFIQSFSFREPQFPVIANVDAKPYQLQTVTHNLSMQLTHSVRWSDSIVYMSELGEANFQEIGPGNVLKGLLRHILTNKNTTHA